MGSSAPRWSSDVRQADWIGPRLAPWGEFTVAMVVPAGFEAYARVLHPVQTPDDGGPLVRWADVAAWSGLPLRSDAEFHSVALPPEVPAGLPPYDSQGPQAGSMYPPDAEALAAILSEWTATPQDCWFCVWDGYGWDNAAAFTFLTAPGQPAETVAEPASDPVPGQVREGPRVQLPNRDYFLYRGPAQDATALAGLDGTGGQCPNIWWPADRAWCVASEVDLQWTYVGGSRGLIDAVLADDRIETLPAGPGDPLGHVEDWVTGWVDELAGGLMERGSASVTTPRGSVEAWLRRPRGLTGGELRIEVRGRDSSGSSTRPGLRGADESLRREVSGYLTFAVLELTGM